MDAPQSSIVVLGRIVAPFGVKGWVKLHPFGDDPLNWGEMTQWWLAPSDDSPPAQWQAVTLGELKAHGAGLVARFEEVADRNHAESLKGWFVGAPREALPTPDADEYYWGDLVGLPVENLAGEALGTVLGLLSTGAHDVLRVDGGEAEERLIPFVSQYVIEVDTAQRRIRVDWQKDW